jgi:hypothetical protein
MAQKPLMDRTDAKLRYAKLHLNELRTHGEPGRGHDFERAHQEAVFAQLFGAYAALLHELNEDLSCGLAPEDVSLGKLRNAMKSGGGVSPKLTALYTLEQDPQSWFGIAKAMRDHVTHVGGIPLSFYVGGPDHTAMHHPKTRGEIPGEYFDTLEQWIDNMHRLVEEMRK